MVQKFEEKVKGFLIELSVKLVDLESFADYDGFSINCMCYFLEIKLHVKIP